MVTNVLYHCILVHPAWLWVEQTDGTKIDCGCGSSWLTLQSAAEPSDIPLPFLAWEWDLTYGFPLTAWQPAWPRRQVATFYGCNILFVSASSINLVPVGPISSSVQYCLVSTFPFCRAFPWHLSSMFRHRAYWSSFLYKRVCRDRCSCQKIIPLYLLWNLWFKNQPTFLFTGWCTNLFLKEHPQISV